MRDITSRSNVFEKFRKEPDFFLKTAKQEGIPLGEVFRIEAPVAEKGDHEDPLLDMIQKAGLRVESNKNYESSTLGDFTRSDYGHYLLFDWLDRCYEDTLLDNRAADSGSTGIDETGYLAGQVYRPYMERPLMERKRIAPQVRIGDIVSRVETVTEDLIRQPEYTTGAGDGTSGPVGIAPSSEEQMVPIAPGGKIPTTIISLGSRTVGLKKVGIGLAVTDEFNSNNIRVSSVQTWVERVAANHEITIVNEGVNTIITGPNTRTGGGAAIGIPDGGGAGNSLGGIINVNTWFEEPYMLDLLITNKTGARAWIATNVQAGGAGANLLPYAGGRFSDIFAPISVVNRNSQATRLAYLSDVHNAATGLANNSLIGIDSRVCLVMYRHARGSVNERERIASQQIEARYMTERYGFMLEDVNARVRFTLP